MSIEITESSGSVWKDLGRRNWRQMTKKSMLNWYIHDWLKENPHSAEQLVDIFQIKLKDAEELVTYNFSHLSVPRLVKILDSVYTNSNEIIDIIDNIVANIELRKDIVINVSST